MEFALAPTEPRSASPPLAEWDGGALHAVCFDIDDTLIDFTAACRGALAAMIGRDDMWWLWEGVTEAHVSRVVAGELDYATMHRLRTRRFLGELGIDVDDADAARFERRRAAVMHARLRVFDDVLPCLRWLRAAGVAIGAITNASGGHQRTKLAAHGLDSYIGEVVIAGEVGAAKPDPLIFHSACAALGSEPAQTLHVGDRHGADAVGALDAGLSGVWLNRHRRAAPDGACADVATIASLDALPELLVNEFAKVGVPVPR